MSTYDFPQLVKRWGLESITSEQAIGQILLHLQSVRERVTVLEARLLQSEEEEIINHVDAEDATEVIPQITEQDIDQGTVA